MPACALPSQLLRMRNWYPIIDQKGRSWGRGWSVEWEMGVLKAEFLPNSAVLLLAWVVPCMITAGDHAACVGELNTVILSWFWVQYVTGESADTSPRGYKRARHNPVDSKLHVTYLRRRLFGWLKVCWDKHTAMYMTSQRLTLVIVLPGGRNIFRRWRWRVKLIVHLLWDQFVGCTPQRILPAP